MFLVSRKQQQEQQTCQTSSQEDIKVAFYETAALIISGSGVLKSSSPRDWLTPCFVFSCMMPAQLTMVEIWTTHEIIDINLKLLVVPAWSSYIGRHRLNTCPRPSAVLEGIGLYCPTWTIRRGMRSVILNIRANYRSHWYGYIYPYSLSMFKSGSILLKELELSTLVSHVSVECSSLVHGDLQSLCPSSSHAGKEVLGGCNATKKKQTVVNNRHLVKGYINHAWTNPLLTKSEFDQCENTTEEIHGSKQDIIMKYSVSVHVCARKSVQCYVQAMMPQVLLCKKTVLRSRPITIGIPWGIRRQSAW